MTANCYVVYDDVSKRCIVIDPGSEKSENEIEFINRHGLRLDYILLTHEHTDHNWGVNALCEAFGGARIVCSEICQKNVRKTNNSYFLFYYNDQDYHYEMRKPDIVILNSLDTLEWNGHTLTFHFSPGHSKGSMCIEMDHYLFSGDTIMPFKPFFSKRYGNKDEWKQSIETLRDRFAPETIIQPGHGESMPFGEWMEEYYNF